ncbi:MAG: ribonuclease III [Bacteroidia bacterium]|nr:MAG: ribonuclease III [Bacteroidia bacterium]PIE86469.1 MAG: ribonuclease III [Bacteroidia bacterium]
MLKFITNIIELHFSQKKEFYNSIKEITGFYPRKTGYYELALIHKSVSGIEPDGTVLNNERLEYLGDAILDAIVGDFLYHKFPKEHEGFLTQMRSKIVNGENLAELAKKIGLHRLIKSQLGNSTGKTKVYEDAFEAFIGAIYLDVGFEKTKNFVLKKVFKNFVDIKEIRNTDTNYKSQLIEWGQKHKREILFTTDIDPKNSKYFLSHVDIDKERYGNGYGPSKKIAEQNAAKNSLLKIQPEEKKEEDNDYKF